MAIITNLVEMYKKILDEDAVVAAGDAGVGEVVTTPAGGTSNEVVDNTNSDNDMMSTEILGSCNHKKDGYLGPKCFHVPKCAFKIKRKKDMIDYSF